MIGRIHVTVTSSTDQLVAVVTYACVWARLTQISTLELGRYIEISASDISPISILFVSIDIGVSDIGFFDISISYR